MKRLLKLEFTRLARQKSFYVCTIIMVSLLFLVETTSKVLMGRFQEFMGESVFSGIHSMINSIGTSDFILISSIFTVLFFCDDFTQHTIKNILAKGYTKKQLFLAKTISGCIAVTIMFFIIELFGLTLGTLLHGFGHTKGTRFGAIIGTQYIAMIANTIMCMAIASKFRKNGSSIIGIIFIPDIIGLILSLADHLFDLTSPKLAVYWLNNLLNDICLQAVSTHRIYECLLGSLLYVPIFAAIGLYFYNKYEA